MSSSRSTWRCARLAFPGLLAALCLTAAPVGGGLAAAGLGAFGDDVEIRPVGPGRIDAAAALGRDGGLASLLAGLGSLSGSGSVGDRGLSVPVALDGAASGGSSRRAAAAAAAPNLGPIVSGLPWRSGASCGAGAFETWRGRRIDVTAVGVGRRDWATMVRNIRAPAFRAAATATPQLVIILPLLPVSEAERFAACAAGNFDARYREIGAALTQAGAGNAVLRLGWEANIGPRSHPWGYNTAAGAQGYVRCFRRAAGVLKLAARGVKIEWSNAKAGKPPFSVMAANPGDDVTDLWGLHYYDVNAQFRTQALWNQFYNSTHLGGPQGLGRWLAVARAHGKRLAVPEWGVWSREVSAAEADNPLYIQNMYNTFRANAATIAYENYYNCPLGHQLHPSTQFPRAGGLYRRLWSQGR